MSITENSATAHLHSTLLGNDISEGYIKTRQTAPYDNDSNKELKLGNVDETQSLSPTTNSDINQNDNEIAQNITQDQNDSNIEIHTSIDEKNSNVSNIPNVSNVSETLNSNDGKTISINNVHDNNIITDEKQNENTIKNTTENENTSENKVNIASNNNINNETSDKKITVKVENQQPIRQQIQQPQIQPQIQPQPQIQQQYQQTPIYNMPVMNQGIIYYQQPPQANYMMMKPDPSQNVRFGDTISPNINTLMPRSASVTSIRGTIPIPLSSTTMNDPSHNLQNHMQPPSNQMPIQIHPLVNGNNTIPISVTSSGSNSNINQTPSSNSTAPNLSATSTRGLHNALVPPEPTYIDDAQEGERYGIRCVCKKGVAEGFLIQCDKCNFWLHGRCVCIARNTRESYICPFCLGHVIRCKCNQNMKYDEPIVQCQRCKFWVHKSCENLMFGIVPQNFICHRCGGREYLLPKIVLKDNLLPNRTSFIECNRFEIMQSIPEGKFRNMVLSDLAKSELSLHETIGRYFQEFAPIFFEFNHEFWKTFVEVFTSILMCDKSMVLLAIDAFAYSLLYKTVPRPHYSSLPTKFGMSEEMQAIINSLNPKRIEKPPTPVSLYVDQDGHVRTSQTLDDEQFIVDIPGFLMLSDELDADDGIPPTCFAITNTGYVIDMEGSCFNIAHQFQRSFHFNTVVKIYKQGDDPRVGLFATRLKGPISEEKGKRGPAVQHDMPLILPFDGEIPFNTPKVEWKERKTKARASTKAKTSFSGSNNNSNNSYSNSRRSSNYNTRSSSTSSRRRSVADSNAPALNFSCSLLSAFCEDTIPPIPIKLLTEKEFAERNKQAEHTKTRARNHKIRNLSDDD